MIISRWGISEYEKCICPIVSNPWPPIYSWGSGTEEVDMQWNLASWLVLLVYACVWVCALFCAACVDCIVNPHQSVCRVHLSSSPVINVTMMWHNNYIAFQTWLCSIPLWTEDLWECYDTWNSNCFFTFFSSLRGVIINVGTTRFQHEKQCTTMTELSLPILVVNG